MKNIFRKFHIGGGHDPNRSGEVSSVPSSSSPAVPDAVVGSCVPDQRTAEMAIPTPSPPSPAEGERGAATVEPADYFSSEEEFQMQLALAISASNSEFREDPDGDQIRAATLLSLGTHRSDRGRQDDGAAESLSRRYWDYNVLDYGEKVVDGFYDIFGLSNNFTNHGKMPSLHDLQTSIGDLGFEVIFVNRAVDSALVELEQVAHCIALDSPAAEVVFLVQRISELVSQHMGGPVKDANDMLAHWIEKSTELRTTLQTSLLPIGCINLGLSRHRALLFKVLADNVGIPCKLVKGSHYTGIDDDAVNIIKYGDNREFLVDLMAAPGTLIPADVLSTKDASSNLYNPMVGQNILAWKTDTTHDNFPKSGFENNLLDGNKMVDKSSSHRKAVLVPFVLGESSANTASSSSGNTESPYTQGPSNQSISFSNGALIEDTANVTVNDNASMNDMPKVSTTGDAFDSRNLFAELNPFQAVGIVRPSMVKVGDSKPNEYQRSREPVASGPGRPQHQSPLVRKNHSPCNDVTNMKHYNFADGLVPRKNLGKKDVNTSRYTSSSTGNSAITPNTNSSIPWSVNMDDSFSGAVSSCVTSGSAQISALEDASVDPQVKKVHLPMQSKNRGLVLRGNTGQEPEYGKISNAKRDRRKHNHDRFIGTNVVSDDTDTSYPGMRDKSTAMDLALASDDTHPLDPVLPSRSTRIDPMLDDVAEWEIPWEDLVIGDRIGLGSYGEVYHADWNGTEVAVKKFLDQDFYGDALDEFRTEVRIMRRLRHPNVVLFMGAVTRPPNLSIVSEFLPRGSLYRILHRPNCQIDEKRRIKMALDVAKGMNCLHTSAPTIVHRDLKSPNLLVDKNWTVKVCDFGLSRLKHSTFLSSKSTAGTPEWMAPEVLRNEPSNEKCDVYSFGVILWELATLRMPWSGMNPMQVVGAVGFQERRLDIPKEVDPLVARIIWECWQTEPGLRPSFAQLMTALKSLQRLVIALQGDSQNPPVPQEIPVNSTP